MKFRKGLEVRIAGGAPGGRTDSAAPPLVPDVGA